MRQLSRKTDNIRVALLYASKLNNGIKSEKTEVTKVVGKIIVWQKGLKKRQKFTDAKILESEADGLRAELLPKIRSLQCAVSVRTEELKRLGVYDDIAYNRIFAHHMNNLLGLVSPTCAFANTAGKVYDGRRYPTLREELVMLKRFFRVLDSLTPDKTRVIDALISNQYMEDALRMSSGAARRIAAGIRKEFLLRTAPKYEP